jgi:hypothetical protein
MAPFRICFFLPLSVIVSSFVVNSCGQKTVSHEQQVESTLVNLEKKSWQAWAKRDGSFFQSFLSDDHVEIGFGGIASKETVVNSVASPDCQVISYKTGSYKCIPISENVALLVYYASQQTVCNGKTVPSPVWVSSLYVKRGNDWVNIAYQQSPASK